MLNPENTPSKSDILRKWYYEVWEQGNLDVIENYFLDIAHNSLNSDHHLIPNFGVDTKELREWLTILHSFVEDIKVNILQTIEEGDWINAMLEINCKHRDTGKDVRVIQQVTIRFEGDKKVESYPAFDFIRFFEQIGQLPEHTHALLLSGTVLR